MIKPPTDHKEALEYVKVLVSYFTGINTIPYSEREIYIDHLLEVGWKLNKLDREEPSDEGFKGGKEEPWFD